MSSLLEGRVFRVAKRDAVQKLPSRITPMVDSRGHVRLTLMEAIIGQRFVSATFPDLPASVGRLMQKDLRKVHRVGRWIWETFYDLVAIVCYRQKRNAHDAALWCQFGVDAVNVPRPRASRHLFSPDQRMNPSDFVRRRAIARDRFLTSGSTLRLTGPHAEHPRPRGILFFVLDFDVRVTVS